MSERHPCIPTAEELERRGVPDDQRRGYSEHRFRTAFGISSWFHRLPEQFTFPTRFVRLSMEDVRNLIAVYENSERKVSPLEELVNSKLQDLIQRVDEAVGDWKDVGVFVKLDSKSAKDFIRPLEDEQMVDLVKIEFEAAQKKMDGMAIPRNVAHSSFLKASGRRMRCTSGFEVCEQLTRSWRVLEDLKATERYMCYGDSYDEYPLHIVIRKWDEKIQEDSEMEFRGFVNKNSLNAVSQYDYLQVYPFIIDNRESIEKRIFKFWEDHLKELLSETHRSYVCDFYVPKNSEDSVKLVELNPFLSSSGPCLFNWSRDNSIILNGPFEFRILSDQTQVQAKDMDKLNDLPKEWLEYLQTTYQIVPKQTNEATTAATQNQGRTEAEEKSKCFLS
eukprot:TRINITY_DN42233_c0_g1_i1.p1 TRINITY_DN42233_c0_g1~~TRINITY_DN42233_c0_g1_i1.p1  ORF type:complete len:390 (-),score=95.74 TRINITY_DN42233_c0_g1_i1:87-1256(-)